MTDKITWPDHAARALATTFYSGYFPVAPGTVGAALAAAAIWFGRIDQGVLLLGMMLLFALAGVWASGRAEGLWGKDPGRVNWDEVVGMMLSLLFLPRSGMVFIAAFLAFRFFDILKPVPVSTAEKLPRGWGIMADDIIAGIYANIVVQIIVHFGLLKG